MLAAEQMEELLSLAATLDRSELIRRFKDYPSQFPVDFTPQFLQDTPLDRLQHIFVALCIQGGTFPGQGSSLSN
jgi:hypothetical protein